MKLLEVKGVQESGKKGITIIGSDSGKAQINAMTAIKGDAAEGRRHRLGSAP